MTNKTERPATAPILLTGCSGGGKSTLLAALARRGYATFEEAGRQIVREETASGGRGLPWLDMDHFVDLMLARASAQFAAARAVPGPAFLDRGVIEAFAWYRRTGRTVPAPVEAAARTLRYGDPVFMAPPWPEIFAGDAERRHDLSAATAEYEAIVAVLAELGYRTVELPRIDVEARADFVLAAISASATP